MDVIILSGGLGTRLRDVVKNIPKTMALIDNKPFLEYTLKKLKQYNVKNVILAVGYKKEYIEEYFGNKYIGMNIIYSEESEPLGTGGAIKKALEKTKEKNIIVINGDIYQNVNLEELMKEHIQSNKNVTLTLKEMSNFDRFGSVRFNRYKTITEFKEKEFTTKGYINVGVYAMKRNIFDNILLNDKFSIEKDYFNKYADKNIFNAYLYNGEFIDIGIPSDYEYLKQKI